MFFLFVCFKKHIFLTFSRAFLLPQLIPPTHPPPSWLDVTGRMPACVLIDSWHRSHNCMGCQCAANKHVGHRTVDCSIYLSFKGLLPHSNMKNSNNHHIHPTEQNLQCHITLLLTFNSTNRCIEGVKITTVTL